MFMIIRDSNGRRREGILLAVSVDRMRVAVPGCEDVMELRRSRNQWIFAGGEPVKIEGMISGADLSGFCSQPLRPGKVA
jgi:hypothetical protein